MSKSLSIYILLLVPAQLLVFNCILLCEMMMNAGGGYYAAALTKSGNVCIRSRDC